MKSFPKTSALALAAASLLWATGTASAQKVQASECPPTYAVAPGDTLSKIARSQFGEDNFRLVYAANADIIGPNPNTIEVGTLLRVPCDADVAAAGPAVRQIAADRTTITGPKFTPAPETPAAVAARPPANVEIVFSRSFDRDFILNAAVIDPWIADVARVTQGRVVFIEPSAKTDDPAAQLDLVERGEVDAAYIFNGHLKESHPLLQLTMQPMMGGTALQTSVALWRIHRDYIAQSSDFTTVHLLGFVGAPPAHLWRVNGSEGQGDRPIVAANQWAVPYFETPAVGSAPQSGDYAMAHGAARKVGVWRDAEAVTEIEGGVYAPTFSVFISKEKWAEIGDADREAIMSVSGEALALRSAAWDAHDAREKAFMLGRGLEIVDADPELLAELQDSARTSWEAWIAAANRSGVNGYRAITAYIDEVATLKTQFPRIN